MTQLRHYQGTGSKITTHLIRQYNQYQVHLLLFLTTSFNRIDICKNSNCLYKEDDYLILTSKRLRYVKLKATMLCIGVKNNNCDLTTPH